jgi:hypothetical protein
MHGVKGSTGALEMFEGRANAVEAVRAWLRCGIRL